MQASTEIKLFRTALAIVVQYQGKTLRYPGSDWNALLNRANLHRDLLGMVQAMQPIAPPTPTQILAPIAAQEVWGAGVTYLRSRDARMEESVDAAGGSCYDRVYQAKRPELFFKATANRVRGPGKPVNIRRDSKWNVPEPELALFINADGHIAGYTIGNDMSSRDIEGENPLYLPQAKVYAGCCGLGPCVLLSQTPPGPQTHIGIRVIRRGKIAFEGETTLAQMKRSFDELRDALFYENTFPHGVFLLTGAGIVPPSEFTLQIADQITIGIDGIGTLTNGVTTTDEWER